MARHRCIVFRTYWLTVARFVWEGTTLDTLPPWHGWCYRSTIMANTDVAETHFWFDGTWHFYTERKNDFDRFVKWFGPPTRGSSRAHVGHWDGIGKDSVRGPRPVKPRTTVRPPPSQAQLEARQRFKALAAERTKE